MQLSTKHFYQLLCFAIGGLFLLSLAACGSSTPSPEIQAVAKKVNEVNCRTALKKHLQAVSDKDLTTLATTLAPDGQMSLILPGSIITKTAKEFLDFHEAWFKDANWTFTTEIIDAEVGEDIGVLIVESMYTEPERDGQPYFNRMAISYGLKKIDEAWYVFKDHACSLEKSTDKKPETESNE